MRGIGWEWAGVIWIFSIVTYIPLDILKIIARNSLIGDACDNFVESKVMTISNYRMISSAVAISNSVLILIAVELEHCYDLKTNMNIWIHAFVHVSNLQTTSTTN